MAGLYDSYQLANTQYMSQFAGSIVPELAKYSETVQNRYNQAQDQDDALTEALGNLQHLQFDGDTQYANELKQTYYQRLLDRSSRGDFENMGRRTRRDAMQFAQAYQPLVQRNRDFAEIVKKVNSDSNIADPNKKAEILNYIKNMNSLKRDSTGEFERDQSGRVNLGAIQDWAYAKDVDINKKLADILSKKEADIKQSGYASDGQGLKISSTEELRSPQVMARLAQQLIDTDPEIKAMINRDVTLRTYNLSKDDITSGLKRIDVSPYDQAKKRGLNDKQIAILAKAEGVTPDQLRTSQVSRQRRSLIDSGMSPEAADKAIYNKLVEQELVSPYVGFASDLLSYRKVKLDAREDGLFLLRAKKAMDDADNGSFQILSNPVTDVNEIHPSAITTDYVEKSRQMDELRSNVNAVTLQALKQAGLSTGDPKKDIALAAQYSDNRASMNALKNRLKGKDLELAGRLETMQNNYLASKDEVGYHEANTKALEEASKVNWDALYATYRKNPTHSLRNNDKKLSKAEFIEAIRDNNSSDRGIVSQFFSNASGFNDAMKQYDKLMDQGANVVREGKAQLNAYQSVIPTGPGYLKNISDFVSNNSKLGTIQFRVLGEGSDKTQDLAGILDINKSKLSDPTSDDYKKMKSAEVHINRNTLNGKRTVTIRLPDGTNRTATIENGVDPNMFKEMDSRLLKQTLSNKNSDMARSQAQDILMSLGESTMNISANDLKSLSAGSVKYPINDKYEVRVLQGGPEGKRYRMYSKDTGEAIKIFNSPEDLVQALGYDENRRTQPQR